jgi:chloramphenicol O-acetyltransferase
MSTLHTANVAKARIIYNKDRETYKIIFAFNVYKTLNKRDEEVYIFPQQKKCNYVSGDIMYETLQADKERIIATAKQYLRTDYVEFV